jgi:hypothetical protein
MNSGPDDDAALYFTGLQRSFLSLLARNFTYLCCALYSKPPMHALSAACFYLQHDNEAAG